MKRIPILLALGLCLSSAAFAQTEAERRARWERGREAQRSFEHRLFTEAGFAPIEDVGSSGRNVRRLLLSDPYMMLPLPGIEIERHPNGRLTLRLQHRGWSGKPIAIDPGAWHALASREEEVFKPPVYTPAPAGAGPPPPPPPICHGWIARFEADDARTASWAACGGGKGAAYDYAAQMVELAVGTKAGCTFDRNDPFWSYQKCFPPTAGLDDPALEAKFAALRQEYDKPPGAELLAQARTALNAPGLALGNEAWRQARAAVAKVKAVNDYRRERLQQLRQLAFSAPDATPGDKARMRQTMDAWADFLHAQEVNYSDLLYRLAWAGG